MDERPHILLREHAPPETRQYSGGGGGTYPRTSYEQHATKVFNQAADLRAMFAKVNPGGPDIDRGYFRIELPRGPFDCWRGRSKARNEHSQRDCWRACTKHRAREQRLLLRSRFYLRNWSAIPERRAASGSRNSRR